MELERSRAVKEIQINSSREEKKKEKGNQGGTEIPSKCSSFNSIESQDDMTVNEEERISCGSKTTKQRTEKEKTT